MPSCGVCLSVRPSVTFVYCVKTSNHIFKKFSPSGIHIILVFPHQRYSKIPRRISSRLTCFLLFYFFAFLFAFLLCLYLFCTSCTTLIIIITEANIAIFDQYLGLGSMTAGMSSDVNNFDRGVILALNVRVRLSRRRSRRNATHR